MSVITDHARYPLNAYLAIIPVAYDIDTRQWREGTLEVLLFSRTMPTGSSLAIGAYASARSPEAPGVFLPSSAGAVGTVTITPGSPGASAPPCLVFAALSANFGSMISIGLVPSVGTGTGTYQLDMQINLSLKS